MIRQSVQAEELELATGEVPEGDDHIAPAPRVSIQAFCETVETAAAIQSAGEDRRLAKAHLKIQMGGVTAAIEAYRGSPTPNVIMLESEGRGDAILKDSMRWRNTATLEPAFWSPAVITTCVCTVNWCAAASASIS